MEKPIIVFARIKVGRMSLVSYFQIFLLFHHTETISNNCSEILCHIISKCFLVILFFLSGFSLIHRPRGLGEEGGGVHIFEIWVSWEGGSLRKGRGFSKLFHHFSLRKACFHYYWNSIFVNFFSSCSYV